MAKSLLHNVNETYNVENATFAIIQGYIIASFVIKNISWSLYFFFVIALRNRYFISFDIMFRL